MTITNAYLIKGWMLEKNAPAEVNQAIEAIIKTRDRGNRRSDISSSVRR